MKTAAMQEALEHAAYLDRLADDSDEAGQEGHAEDHRRSAGYIRELALELYEARA